jgi:hypothetical protein
LRPGGGFELATGCHVNGVWPEVAAEYLRREEIAAETARHPEATP